MKVSEVRWLLLKPGLEVVVSAKLNDNDVVNFSVPKDSVRRALKDHDRKTETSWFLDPDNENRLILG